MNRCVSIATPQKSKSDLTWAKLSVKIPFFFSVKSTRYVKQCFQTKYSSHIPKAKSRYSVPLSKLMNFNNEEQEVKIISLGELKALSVDKDFNESYNES